MTIHDTHETRAVTLIDIPLVRRLSEQGTVLDSELYYTRDAGGPHGPRFFSLLLPYGGVHTFVTRVNGRELVAQFRLRENSHPAHITYLAPTLEEGDDDSAWLTMLDRLAVEAGRCGAHTLTAEVDESAPLFRTMRQANYSIYARQEIWYHPPLQAETPLLPLTLLSEADLPDISSLYGYIIPRLVQPIAELPPARSGLVYRTADGRLEGFIGVAKGKYGVYLTPHLHPDAFKDAGAVMNAALAQIERVNRVPVYVRVRRYQDWLDDTLCQTGFSLVAQQAVMVKHIAAGVRSAMFAAPTGFGEGVIAKPPSGLAEGYTEHPKGKRTEVRRCQSSNETGVIHE